MTRRLGAGEFTVHGMRSAARSWMADQGVAFELAEAALGHQVGNAVVQAYQRSSMLERRRPVLAAWADFVTGSSADRRRRASQDRGVIRMVRVVVGYIAGTVRW